MEEKTASCLGVRAGFIRRNARMSVARPMDMVLAAEVAKLLSAEEERKKNQLAPRRPVEGTEDGGSTMRKRNARIGVARPVDPDWLAAEVAAFRADTERRPCNREDGPVRMRKRGARISVARPVDLGIDPDMLAAVIAEFRAVTERRQSARRPCQSEDGPMVRRARISVAGPVDLGIDPGWLAAEIAEFRAATERRQASQRAKRDAAGRIAGRAHGRRRHAKVVLGG